MIGLFDSGLGGLSVWREVVKELPARSTFYVGDQVHIPYGPRPADTLVRYAEGITRFLREQRCQAVVVACNSASAAALKPLRQGFPDTVFVGMEPAVKPAAARTKSGVVLVLATPATLKGELFTATTARYAQGVKVIGEPCPGLVEQIESGRVDTEEIETMLRAFLAPGLAAGADQVVLACTHYPFVIETVRRLAGPAVEVIDPAPAVARQLRRLLREAETTGAPPTHRFFTTGTDLPAFARAIGELTGTEPEVGRLEWIDESRLTMAG
jgi:glutamate racemase